eukprot:Hpha_TRINITY_DN12247_c0_g1::TRINITY_DN12247_c0_g1_i1::g.17016::m.17016
MRTSVPIRWEKGEVCEIGDSPMIRSEKGDVVPFAYRLVQWFGNPRTRINVGDKVRFMRRWRDDGTRASQVCMQEYMVDTHVDDTHSASSGEHLPREASLSPAWKPISASSGHSTTSTASNTSHTSSTLKSPRSECTSNTATRWRYDPYSQDCPQTVTQYGQDCPHTVTEYAPPSPNTKALLTPEDQPEPIVARTAPSYVLIRGQMIYVDGVVRV